MTPQKLHDFLDKQRDTCVNLRLNIFTVYPNCCMTIKEKNINSDWLWWQVNEADHEEISNWRTAERSWLLSAFIDHRSKLRSLRNVNISFRNVFWWFSSSSLEWRSSDGCFRRCQRYRLDDTSTEQLLHQLVSDWLKRNMVYGTKRLKNIL